MPAFRFDLERLLEHRRRTEKDRQRAVAALERERLALEQRIREHQRALASTRDDLRAALVGERAGPEAGPLRGAGRVDPRALRLQTSASLSLTMKTQSLVFGLAGLLRRIDAARLELLDAATKRKAVELLRKRRFEAWGRAEARREAAELDDFATMRAGERIATAAPGSTGPGMPIEAQPEEDAA